MYPYLTLRGVEINMTGLGIVIGFITFLIASFYLTQKYRLPFWKLFYRLPLIIVLMYLLGSYVQFIFTVGRLPTNYEELLVLLSPYGYEFHFVGILLGFTIGLRYFFKNIKRYEIKKIWVDVLFFSLALSMVPIGIFFLLGDDFIGMTTKGLLGVQPLHPDSELNKFTAVLPIGLFLSIGALLVTFVIGLRRRHKKKMGYGMLGFALLLIVTNAVFFVQQYPRHGVLSLGDVTFDIKQYVSFLVIMLCLYIYHKRDQYG